MELNPLIALSPLDGRYAAKGDALRAHFSEYGLIKNRVRVELAWLKALSLEPAFAEIPPFSATTVAEMDAVMASFDEDDAQAIKEIEARTNHDVKALEYWLKQRFAAKPKPSYCRYS